MTIGPTVDGVGFRPATRGDADRFDESLGFRATHEGMTLPLAAS
jgi:hypothetical protein